MDLYAVQRAVPERNQKKKTTRHRWTDPLYHRWLQTKRCECGMECDTLMFSSLAPGILILDVVQTRSLLDWSHTGAFDFSRYVCVNIIGGRAGTHWIQFKLRKILWFWILMTVPPQCQHDREKNGVWSLILAWWRMKRVSCFCWLKNGTLCWHTPRLCEHL